MTIRKHATKQHNLPDIAKTYSWRAISKVPRLFEQTAYSSAMKCRVLYVVMDVNKFYKLHYDILHSNNIVIERQQKYTFIYYFDGDCQRTSTGKR
jgi:hypothetical protein